MRKGFSVRCGMKKLNFETIRDLEVLSYPKDPEELTLASPAVNFFTDFEKVKPLILDGDTDADTARQMMLKSHVRLKLVVDDNYKFIGIVSLDDISDQKITATQNKLNKRGQILVSDLMVGKSNLRAFDYSQIINSTIEDVIEHLKSNGQQHCLVVDRASNKIRGIFSASDISRKLGLPVNIQDQSSFYKVFSAVAS